MVPRWVEAYGIGTPSSEPSGEEPGASVTGLEPSEPFLQDGPGVRLRTAIEAQQRRVTSRATMINRPAGPGLVT